MGQRRRALVQTPNLCSFDDVVADRGGVPDTDVAMEALERGQRATEKPETTTKRLSKRMEILPWALVVLTVVVILTGILVYGEFIATLRKSPSLGKRRG